MIAVAWEGPKVDPPLDPNPVVAPPKGLEVDPPEPKAGVVVLAPNKEPVLPPEDPKAGVVDVLLPKPPPPKPVEAPPLPKTLLLVLAVFALPKAGVLGFAPNPPKPVKWDVVSEQSCALPS